jgi:glycosyltransferase involved in cell wall biosynthesis
MRCYFVSEANRRLAEKQIGIQLGNAEIIRNPFNVPFNAAPPWPSGETAELRLASVARLDLAAKGQDILLEALAAPPWDARKWHLTFYGEGPHEEVLRRLTAHLRLATHIEGDPLRRTHRVAFAGFAEDVQEIWAANHVLVMPSRVEGLPLAMVEAMLCGRPVIATDVAGHSEILEDGTTGFLAKAATVDAFRSALEQAWQKRSDLKRMGELAAKRIRQLIPDDPIEVFSEKIMTIAGGDDRRLSEKMAAQEADARPGIGSEAV